MYNSIQVALTYAFQAIAIIGISGIISHAFYTSHCEWMAENCPPVKPFQEEVCESLEPQPLLIVEPQLKPEIKVLNEAIASTEVIKSVKVHDKKTPQLKLQPLSVGAAAFDYSVLSSEQLRKECALQSVNWRSGGDYGKPMKKAQMLAALK